MSDVPPPDEHQEQEPHAPEQPRPEMEQPEQDADATSHEDAAPTAPEQALPPAEASLEEPATHEPTSDPSAAPEEHEQHEPAQEQPEQPEEQPEQPEPAHEQPEHAEATDAEATEPAPAPGELTAHVATGEHAQEQPDTADAADDETGEPAEAAHAEAGDAEAAEAGDAEAAEAGDAEAAEAADGEQSGEQGKKKRKKRNKKKPAGPTVDEVVARIGTTTEAALAYVESPEPSWQRLPRAAREELIADLPAPTAAALLGPAALARHFVASAASGRYRDLFALWTLFSRHPQDCKPELAERGQALERARRNLRLATKIGLTGHAWHVAEDIQRAEGLIWQWLRQVLDEQLHVVGARPIVAAALLRLEPDAAVPLPDDPPPLWLAEAAAARQEQELPAVIEERLGANVHRLPATISTLRLAATHYPDRIPHLLDAVDLDAPDVDAFLAWARDHGHTDRLVGRVRERLDAVAAQDREAGLALWHRWRERGVDLELPPSLLEQGLGDLDLARPETAHLAKALLDRGEDVAVQQRIEELAGRNRQLAEKAYEAATSAGIAVTLPPALETNPVVKEGTRCPRCHAWTWVRPGHEQRCPWPEPQPTASPGDAFELAAAEASEQQ